MTGPEAAKRAPRLASTAALASETRLARRAAKRDERAFEAIFSRYHQEIYRFCLSILGNVEDARDALQNTMLKALQALPGEERQIRLKPWLYRVAHNESIDLVRKRRETAVMDPELAAPGDGLAETAAQRERLRQLLHDLGYLPERQRAALVMRELGGLGFEQIAEAFDTSPAVARQTVYEARMSLRGLEEGREMSCEEVMHRLSNADGRVGRRRDLRAHLRACPDCRAFHDAIDARRRDFAALAPLPAIASAGVLHAILGGAPGAAGGTAGAGGATVAAGAGKAVSAGLLAKSVATVAVVAAVGVSAADRSGLIHTGLPGGPSGATSTKQIEGEDSAQTSGASSGAQTPVGAAAGSQTSTAGKGSGGHAATAKSSPDGKAVAGQGKGTTDSSPSASQHGRETAAAHGHGGSASHGQGHGLAPSAVSHSSQHGSHHGHGRGHVKPKAAPHPHPAPAPAAPKPSHEAGSGQSAAETTSKTEQSSVSADENSESSAEYEGMP